MTGGRDQLPERHQKEHRLRIVCVNDVYSFAAVDGHGGWCRAATLMRKLKRDLLDRTSSTCSSTCDVLTFVNGDVMGGSSLLQHSKGRLAIDIMNEIPIDGCVLGNHEFDYGPSALGDCISASNFDWFGSNVVKANSSRLLDGVLDYQVKVLKCGLKVGVFGLCTQATPHLSNPSSAIEFLNVEETARRVVSHLRDIEGVQVVIALTHLAAAQDKQLSESVEGIDIILGGHDHEPLAFEHHHTLVFKTGQNCYWVGSVDVDILIDEGGSHGVQVFPSWGMHSTCRVKEDRGVEAIVHRYQRLVDEQILLSHGDALQGMNLEDIVAKVTGDTLDTRTAQVRRRESSSGNFIADALLSYYGAGRPKYQTDGIDTMAFINGGFIRGDKRYVAGTNLTLRDVLEEMPFPKVSCLLELQGKHLWQAMEQQLRACPAASGGFPHISANVSIEYDVNLPPLSRIKKFMINGREVDGDRKYRVVVTDFVASGGDGASAWCFGVQQSIEGRPSKRISTIVLNHLKNTLWGKLQAKVDGRVRCVVD